jgi:hypothetical protein
MSGPPTWTDYGRKYVVRLLAFGPLNGDVSAADEYPPSTFSMPDLADLQPDALANHAQNRILRKAGGEVLDEQIVITGFLRYVDKALREYKESWQAMQKFVTTNSAIAAIFVATDHMENCIGSLHKADSYLSMLQRNRHRDKKYIYVTDELLGRIKNIRDSAEHTIDKLKKRELQPPDPFILQMGSDCVSFGSSKVTYDELANVLTRLHQLAHDLADFHPPIE